MNLSLPSAEDFSLIVNVHLNTILKQWYPDEKWTKNTVGKLTSFMIDIFEKVFSWSNQIIVNKIFISYVIGPKYSSKYKAKFFYAT